MNKRWKHTVNFKHFWESDIPVEEKGKLAAKELRSRLLQHYPEYWELEEIIDMFDCVSGDTDSEGGTNWTAVEDFDERMRCLYDWADANMVWVSTL